MRSLRTVFLLMVTMSLAACGTSPPARFYTLDPVYDGPQIGDLAELRIGTGPFHFPSMLDRPSIVVRGEGNEIIIDQFARWADDLQGRFHSVLMRNLVLATGAKQVYEFPWRDELNVDYSAIGIVDVFSADTTGKVMLAVRWMIVDGESGTTLVVKESTYYESSDPDDFGEMAVAMSKTIGRFATDVARELTTLKSAGTRE